MFEILSVILQSIYIPFSMFGGLTMKAFSYVSTLIFRSNSMKPLTFPPSSSTNLAIVEAGPNLISSIDSISNENSNLVAVDIDKEPENTEQNYIPGDGFPTSSSLLSSKTQYPYDTVNLTMVTEVQVPGKNDDDFPVSKKRRLVGGIQTTVPPRMNHFVAFQVSDPIVKQNVREVQERLLCPTTEIIRRRKKEVASGEIFRDTLISQQKLHFTLHVFELVDKNEKQKAKEATERVWNEFKEGFEATPLQAEIRGMGHFQDNVLFAKIGDEKHVSRIQALANRLREEFESYNIRGETRPFNPHMTVAKISQSRKLKKSFIRAFPREIWKEFEMHYFGEQKIEGIQLLAMQGKDPTSGYYRCLAFYPF